MRWNRHRFQTHGVADPHPVIFNPAWPWWLSSTAGDESSATIVAFLPVGEPLKKYWPDAFAKEVSVREKITFTSRFPKPAYFREDASSPTPEQRLYDLSAALLHMVTIYEGDTGFGIEYLDRVRAYLEGFPDGQRVLGEDENNILTLSILEDPQQ